MLNVQEIKLEKKNIGTLRKCKEGKGKERRGWDEMEKVWKIWKVKNGK